jgi:hypothetical protein
VHPVNFPRQDKGVSPDDKSHALCARFLDKKRTEFTPDLSALREQLAVGQEFPLPSPDTIDWYDGTRIKGAALSPHERVARAYGQGEAVISGTRRP